MPSLAILLSVYNINVDVSCPHLSMCGVSMAGWPVTPRSPQPRSSMLMRTKLGWGGSLKTAWLALGDTVISSSRSRGEVIVPLQGPHSQSDNNYFESQLTDQNWMLEVNNNI